MLDCKIAQRASNFTLMVFLQQIICLVIRDVVTLCHIPHKCTACPFSEIKSDLSYFPRCWVWQVNVNQ